MNVSAQITAFLVSHQVVPSEKQAVYKYGFELLLADLLSFLIILIIGGIFGQFNFSIYYLLCFVSARSFCGGYHANTHAKCSICMITSFVAFLLLNQIFSPTDIEIILLVDIAASIMVIRFAPIPHANKPLLDSTRKMNRKRAIILFYVLIIISYILCSHNRQEGVAISLTLWIVSFSMIPAINLQKKGGAGNE